MNENEIRTLYNTDILVNENGIKTLYNPAIPDKIIHQTQLYSNSCLATCAAMVSGVNTLDIKDELRYMGVADPKDYIDLMTIEKLLARHNILLRSSNITDISSKNLFIVSVPYIGKTTRRYNVHSLVVDNRHDTMEIYDPLKGFICTQGIEHIIYDVTESKNSVVFDQTTTTYGVWRCDDCNVCDV